MNKNLDFSKMSVAQLRQLETELLQMKKARHKQYIAPQQKQHFKPLREKYIKPLIAKYIKPINDTLRELRKNLPKEPKTFWSFKGIRINEVPITKAELIKQIQQS